MAWIPAWRKYTATSAADQNITLERLAMPASTSGFLMAQIPIGGSSAQSYTVEARRFAGYDNTGPIPGEAVVIHNVDTTRGDRLAQVVDPDGNGDPNDASAMWLPGETFTDSANGISVKVTGATSSGFTISINPSADNGKPRVIRTEVGTAGGVYAFFSEPMNRSTLNTAFKLINTKTNKAVGAVIKYTPLQNKALLDPNNPLKPGTKYKAVISTQATDVAGNHLDQKPNVSGDQAKVWFFTYRR